MGAPMPPVSSLRRPIGGCAATCTTRRPSRGITTNLVSRGDALNRGERTWRHRSPAGIRARAQQPHHLPSQRVRRAVAGAPCRPRPPQGEQSLPVHHASRKGRSGGFAGAPRAVAAGDNAGSGTSLNGERRGHNNVQPRRSALVLTCLASPRLSADGESSTSQRGSALIHWRSPGSAAHRGGN